MDNVRTNHKAPGDSLFARAQSAPVTKPGALDDEDGRALLRQLLSWLREERELQAENRMDMAIDADMYDGLQWRPEDAAEVEARGQMPLVFNEVAPMVDWMIGTERRSRVDAKVLPRTEDDVQMADIKTRVMKYMSDVNRSVYVRSQAFAEAMKAGLSWIEDGVRDDPTKEVLFKRKESWRNVLHDSRGAHELDLSGCRYIFRWRMVDLDVAKAMFPQRAALLESSAVDVSHADAGEDALQGWGAPLESYQGGQSGSVRSLGGAPVLGSTGSNARRQVKIYECQFRRPATVRVVEDGPFAGAILTAYDRLLAGTVERESLSIIERVMMRMHVALFVEGGLLAVGESPARHNEFSLTPVWCYRRGRDNLPYGMIRRVRDLQLDLNKRASKASFLINTNQVIADEDATHDWDTLRDEASRPDGVMTIKRGARFELRRDGDQVAGQVELMRLDAQSIQKSGGVADENLGRQTNAVSGEAIKARQLQGSVVTTELFDNLRLATQLSGSKELSLLEQFMTNEKVIRLTGEQGALEWTRVNRMEVGADGQIRVLDDLTASMADFVVSEQDYAGSMRQAMFDALNQIAARLPPEIAMRLLRMAYEFSDMPNKDAIVAEFRRITGEPDPNKEPSPEEQAQAQQRAQAEAEAMEMQRQDAKLALEERAAKVREINAKAAKLEAEVSGSAGEGPEAAGMNRAAMDEAIRARAEAQSEIDALRDQLAKQAAEFAVLRAKADNSVEVARIAASAEERKAEIGAASDQRLAALNARLDDAMRQIAALKPPAATPDELTTQTKENT